MRGRVDFVDLFPEFRELVGAATSEPGFKASLWGWIAAQRHGGPLEPFLVDVEHFFPRMPALMTWLEARQVVEQIAATGYRDRALAVCAHFEAVSGRELDCGLILLAGLERPEGYSRFHRGRNTVHVALDHRSNLRHADHLELIVAHELTHSLRDPDPDVLADRGGWPGMSHDEFLARYPLPEHLVSEALATALSELAYPGRPGARYVYLEPEEYAWCEAHHPEIAARIERAIEARESHRIFFAPDVVIPGSPECCDYYLALQLGRFALAHATPDELLRMPASACFARFWRPFLDAFLSGAARDSAAPAAGEALAATGDALEAASVRAATADAPPDAVGLQPARRGPHASRALRATDHFTPEVARFYHELLAADAAGQDAALLETVKAAGLLYGDAPYDVSAYPLVLGADDLAYVRWVTEAMAALIERVVELYRTDPEVRAYFDLPPHLEALALLEPGYRPYVPVGRFDSYWNGRRLQFLELNTNGTAGVVLADRLSELATQLPQLRPLVRRHGLARLELRQRLLETLEATWQRARPEAGRPQRLGILDWPGGPTATELEQLAAFLTERGLPAVVVHPQQLVFEGGALSAEDARLDLIYRRLTTTDIVERAPELEPFLAACRANAVVVVGSFPADVAHSKRTFAFLTDERWRARFSMEERTLIDAHVPWTRILRSSRTIYRGHAGDLRELVLEHRERLVLKPTESYEGRGVLLGLETTPAEWAGELERRFGGHHLVQEYVEPPQRIQHVYEGGVRHERALFMHLGEYVLDGRLAGLLARASWERVLNVLSSEHTLPAFVTDPAQALEPDPPP